MTETPEMDDLEAGFKICPHCEKELSEEFPFCPNCGKPIVDGFQNEIKEGAGDDPMAVGQDDSQGVMLEDQAISPKRSKIIAGIISSIILIGAVIGGYLVWQHRIDQASTPEQVANNFMKDMAAQNYADAYKYLNKVDTGLLSEQCFEKAQEATINQYGLIKNYNLETSGIPTTSTITVGHLEVPVTIERNQSQSDTITLTNIGTKEKPNWKVETNSLYKQYTLQLTPMPGINVSVDGIPFPINNNTVKIDTFTGTTPKLQITGNEIKTMIINLPDQTDKLNYPQLLVSDSLQTTLQNVYLGQNNVLLQAGKDYNTSRLSTYVKQGSPLWNNLVQGIQEIKNYHSKIEVTNSKFEYSPASFIDKDTIKMQTRHSCTPKLIYVPTGYTESSAPVDNTYFYTFQRQDDGNWLITDRGQV